ncbi:hypothetical protein [Streptomyces sp. NPDC102462]|uniref:hypothetical protein n=1 Tax=Streptomyces sp. NPDC102462 TaxID=3366178 RepID=UPI00382333A9
MTLPTTAHSAASYILDCSTTGATGYAAVSGQYGLNDPRSRGQVWTVTLQVKDTASDGHHVRIRLLTRRYEALDAIRYWTWHPNYDGYGTTRTFNTTAQDTVDGVSGIGIEAATFEGTRRLHSCTDWA